VSAWQRWLGIVLLPSVAMLVWPLALRAAGPTLPEPSPGAQQSVDVWVDLDLPALATLPRGSALERKALRARIMQQQDAVMAQLLGLGGHELGRVQQLRNTLAVRLPSSQLDAARRLPDVHRVRPVRDVERLPPSSKD
jgi:hypothetical protein